MKQRSAILLLVVVFICPQTWFVFHASELESHHHETSCSEGDHENACHFSVFHSDSKKKCPHPTHLSIAQSDCELCDLIAGSIDFHWKISLESIDIDHQSTRLFHDEEVHITSTDNSSYPKRGPPVV